MGKGSVLITNIDLSYIQNTNITACTQLVLSHTNTSTIIQTHGHTKIACK